MRRSRWTHRHPRWLIASSFGRSRRRRRYVRSIDGGEAAGSRIFSRRRRHLRLQRSRPMWRKRRFTGCSTSRSIRSNSRPRHVHHRLRRLGDLRPDRCDPASRPTGALWPRASKRRLRWNWLAPPRARTLIARRRLWRLRSLGSRQARARKAVTSRPLFSNTNGVACAENNPRRDRARGLFGAPSRANIGYSLDGGKTWQPPRSAPQANAACWARSRSPPMATPGSGRRSAALSSITRDRGATWAARGHARITRA